MRIFVGGISGRDKKPERKKRTTATVLVLTIPYMQVALVF
jgi:hypothetical protein